MRRRLGPVAACLTLAACGANPAGPSATPSAVVVPAPVLITPETNLPEGAWRLAILTMPSALTLPSAGDCTGGTPGLPFVGVIVQIDVRLTRTGQVSIIRSATPADGAIELQYGALRADRSAEGWVRGVGEDFLNKVAPASAARGRVIVAGANADEPATTEARVVVTIPAATGTLTGQVSFRGTPVGDVSCRAALWTLRRPDAL